MGFLMPAPPTPPPAFNASDGTVWATQEEADTRNAAVQKNADQQQARDRGYIGDFGSGGYARFVENYAPDPNNPTGRWQASNDSNVGRAGQDVSASRDAARAAGYTDAFGGGGFENFQAEQSASAAADDQQSTHQQALDEIEARRVADEEYFNQRLATIEEERKEIQNQTPAVTNETKAKTAKSELYKRLFGRRSLLTTNASGYGDALGG